MSVPRLYVTSHSKFVCPSRQPILGHNNSTTKELEFEVEEKGEILKVTVPTFRATKDVSIKEDLVEEVARLYGYDNIQPKPLAFDTAPQELIKSIEYEYETKLFLAQKYGANELQRKSLCSPFKVFNRFF